MKRTVLVTSVVAAAAAVGLAGTAFAADGNAGPGQMGHMGRWNDGRGFSHPILAILCMVAVGAAVGGLVWLLVRRRPVTAAAPFAPMAAVASPTAGAEAILAERLARSEISPDDYRSMIAALREPIAPPPPQS
jgi:uncharacterized membrane protein